ncbi:MAG TPA: hypothetical protein VJZ25_07080 [Gemmatimonadaceae bacterium]|nr:hypothetical protein [Gemmatimonadaceae bacterium]
MSLPTWAVSLLLWANGGLLAVAFGLLYRQVESRRIEESITAAATSLREELLTTNQRLELLEREVFGFNGEDGLRQIVHALREEST